MQSRYTCLLGSRLRITVQEPPFCKTIHVTSGSRHFATRKPPTFGSSKPPSAGPQSHQPRSVDSNAAKSASKEKPNSSSKAPEEAAARPSFFPKWPIGPGKLILLALSSYFAYRLYIWQTNPRRSRILNPRFFAPFILENRRKISSTSSILEVLSLPQGQNTDNVLEAWQTGIWSVQVMQPELQIARSYTPLPPKEGAEAEQLRLFVRQEPQGEVSSMLHRISRGTLVHLRGPQIEYAVPENVDEVLFLAGGTGIAPALQVAHVLYNHRLSSSSSSDHQPKLRILWANRHREDSHSGLRQESIEPKDDKLPKDSLQSISQSQNPLVDEVDSLKVKHPGKVSVEYFVDDDNSLITESLLRKYLADVVQKSEQIVADRSNGRKLLLISGPEGFIDHYAGPKFIKAGKEVQGPLGGMLEKIKPQGWEIWKL